MHNFNIRLLTILTFFLKISSAFADCYDTVNVTQTLDFGSLRTLTTLNTSAITVTTSGSYSNPTRIAEYNGAKNGIINYASRRLLTSVPVQMRASGTTTLACTSNCSEKANSCTLTISNLTVDPSNQVSIRAFSNRDFNFGGTLSIPENCGSGTFTGSAVVSIEPDIWLQGEDCTRNLNITAILKPQPITISVDSSQNLNFGQVLSKSVHTVTVTTGGTCSSTDSSMILNSSSCSAGKFYINKNDEDARQVNINISATPLTNLNGSGTLSLSNFSLAIDNTSIPLGQNVFISQSSSALFVGASLNIPQDTNMGTYQGNYVVTISY